MADGAPAVIGTVLGEAYRLTREIGRGGMGAVYEGVHLRLNRRVAIKLMARELATNIEALARFQREAEVTSQLGHPHIVQVFDFGQAPSGEPYLVMEFLEGEDLEGRIRRVGRLDAPATAHIIKQVASALAATHAKGIVHRDLKPANVFVLAVEGETDFVKVVDFGISKVKAATVRLTSAAAVMGTPNYMSPEQAAGRIDEIDSATDQWALACIAYELLAGRPPFVGENIASLLYQVVHEAPSPLAASTPGLPGGVEDVLRCALAKRPSERFASVAAFARAFETAVAGGAAADVLPRAAPAVATATGLARAPTGPATLPQAAATTFSAAAGEAMTMAPSAPRRRVALGVGAIAVAAAAIGALVVSKSGGAPPPVAATASPTPAAAPVAPAPPSPAPAMAPIAAPIVEDHATTTATRGRHKKGKGATSAAADAPPADAPGSDAPTWPPQPAAAPAKAPPAGAPDAPTWPPQPAASDAPTWPPPSQATGAADGTSAKPARQRRHFMRDLKQKVFGN